MTTTSQLESLLTQRLGAHPDAAVTARVLDSPVGPLVSAAVDEGVVFVEFADEKRLVGQIDILERHFGSARVGSHRWLDRVERELGEYFAGRRVEFEVPLVIKGTSFQERVWHALLAIPYGETRAYVEVASSLGLENGQRAVGLANGQNRIAIIVPCHRVIEKGGGLRGYGGGLWRKKFLLDFERRYAPGGALAGTPLGGVG
jgi:AraC family transcriptional regulator of adaptative response/methylated-DNA-[protein]-cysteine methyltransferase